MTSRSARMRSPVHIQRNSMSEVWSRFDAAQSKRTVPWGSDEKQLCARCHKPVSWSDFTVDHILAYARGGRTSLRNAQPMHRRCNSRKGSR
jgi:5-methylcytosine-specific restriction endonuclease McrA